MVKVKSEQIKQIAVTSDPDDGIFLYALTEVNKVYLFDNGAWRVLPDINEETIDELQ